MKVDCVGCGAVMELAECRTLCYTCGCGATLFLIDGKLSPPASLVLRLSHAMIGKSKEISHLDYYLGTSNYEDKRKSDCISFLHKLGAKWSWECTECRNQTVLRFIARIEHHLVDIHTLHPGLRRAILEKSPLVRV